MRMVMLGIGVVMVLTLAHMGYRAPPAHSSPNVITAVVAIQPISARSVAAPADLEVSDEWLHDLVASKPVRLPAAW